jgi:hypothetical protein
LGVPRDGRPGPFPEALSRAGQRFVGRNCNSRCEPYGRPRFRRAESNRFDWLVNLWGPRPERRWRSGNMERRPRPPGFQPDSTSSHSKILTGLAGSSRCCDLKPANRTA